MAYVFRRPQFPAPHAEEAPKTMLSLVEKDSGRTIDIRSGETVQITLPENATTGYRWAIDALR